MAVNGHKEREVAMPTNSTDNKVAACSGYYAVTKDIQLFLYVAHVFYVSKEDCSVQSVSMDTKP